MFQVPCQPSRIPSHRGTLSQDSGLPHFLRNSMGTSGNVCFDCLLASLPGLPLDMEKD